MGIIRFAIDNPVKVAVAVILLVLFGMLSIFQIPIQLTPDVDRPLVTVSTFWEGASPQEIEREIVRVQEEKLKGVRNLKKMTSSSSQGMSEVTLEFYVGTDKDAALQDVSEKLRQVPSYPEDVDEPTIQPTGAEMSNTIAWIMFRGASGEDVSDLKDFVEDDIKPILERAEGIASVDVYGGREREVRVTVDPYKLAARSLTLRDLERALRRQNDNISAGTIAQGKRDYTYRTVGQYEQVEDVENTVIAYRNGGPVFVRHVATVENTFKKRFSFVKSVGDYVLALPARKETGSNVMSAMANLKEQIRYCNDSILSGQGRSLTLTQVYDETAYITSAIGLVTNNLLVGGALAVVVLIIFLRSASATGIVAFTIPISVISTFLAVAALGRNLNVVMLAGMAFSVGMVVDNAIVVLENIYRHRQLGKTATQAALDGTREVWGAVLASTLTTMAVFLPVVFIEEEAGQLFRDIAIAICCAVGLSLAVATTVIPTLASRTLKVSRRLADAGAHTGRVAALVAGAVGAINRSWIARLMLIVFLVGVSVGGSYYLTPATDYLPSGNRNLVFGFVVTPPGYTIETFKTMAETIESGSADDPVGLSDYWNAEVESPAEAALPPVTMHVGTGKETVEKIVPAPPIQNFFFVAWSGSCFMGATSKHEARVKPLIEILNHAGGRVPGTMTFFAQSSLFGGLGAGNSIELEIRGDELDEVTTAAGALMMPVMEKFGFPRPSPTNFALGRPEIRILADREKAADLGLDVSDIGFMVAACVDGAYVGSFYDRGDEIDLKIHVKDTEQATIQEIGQTPIHAPGTGSAVTASAVGGRIVPLSSAVKFVSTTAPQQINHIEEMPAVTLTVNPPEGMALETAMGILKDDIIAPMRQAGAIPDTVITTLAGTADKLTQTRRALFGDFRDVVVPRSYLLSRLSAASTPTWLGIVAVAFLSVVVKAFRFSGSRPARIAAAAVFIVLLAPLLVDLAWLVIRLFWENPQLLPMLVQSRAILALVVTYLLMAALFESFVWPFVIIFTVPLATVGGFVGLRIVHELSWRDPVSPIQQLDTLTMLGFVVLIGVVVNNGILVVHQALNNRRDHNLAWPEAIRESVRTRVRPIFMTAFTSIGGMLPLVLWPGSGSELYRGLGSVVVGGLLVATLFTLFLVPAVLSVAVDLGELLRRLLKRQPAPSTMPVQPEPVGRTAPGA